MTLQEMQNHLQSLQEELVALQANGSPEAIDAKLDEVEALKAQVREARTVALTRPVAASKTVTAPVASMSPVKAAKPVSLGSFALDVLKGTVNVQAGQTEVDAEGGYLVPVDARQDIINRVWKNDDILGRCTQIPTQEKSVTWPYFNGGITATIVGEGAQIPTTFGSFDQVEIPVKSAKVLIPIAAELATDAPALTAFLTTEVSKAIRNLLVKLVLGGKADGTEGLKGIYTATSGATVSVARESSGNTAGVLALANIDNLWAALTPEARANAVWVLQPKMEKALNALRDPETKARVFIPAGVSAPNITQGPAGTIYGRPVFLVDTAPNELALVDFSGYFLVNRSGLDVAYSIHFKFDTATDCLRVMTRVGGAPGWKSSLTLADESVRSYAAVLANAS